MLIFLFGFLSFRWMGFDTALKIMLKGSLRLDSFYTQTQINNRQLSPNLFYLPLAVDAVDIVVAVHSFVYGYSDTADCFGMCYIVLFIPHTEAIACSPLPSCLT